MSAIRTACSERSAGGERGGDGEEGIVWMGRIVFVIVAVIVIVERPRKRFESDESGKRQIGVSGVEGERVWKRAGGSAAAGCWGHFLFLSLCFLLWDGFWEGLEGFVIFFILNPCLDGFWWELGILMFVVVVVCIRLLFFSNFKSGPC